MDIFIIDKDATKLTMLDSEYNLMTIAGDGSAFSTLRQAILRQRPLLFLRQALFPSILRTFEMREIFECLRVEVVVMS